MSSIKRLPSGSWQTIVSLGFREDPRTGERSRVQRRVTRASKREVELEVARLLAEYGRGTTDPGQLTFGEFLDYWLETVSTHYRPNGLRVHRSAVRAWQATPAGHTRLSRLSRPDLIRPCNTWSAQGSGPRTVSQRITTARIALGEALEWGWLSRNPAASLKGPQPNEKRPQPWAEADAVRCVPSPS